MIPTLTSSRLTLKPLSSIHLSDEYVAWMNDKEVIRYLDSGGDYTREKLTTFLADVDRRQILFWAIHITVSDKHIGNIKIDPLSTRHGTAEYSILLGDRSEWGKGYAREASNLVIKYCFEELSVRKVTLGVVKDNSVAMALYGRLGFVAEGEYKFHGWYDGAFRNVVRMALFNPRLQ